jgi:hypothetical protein
VDTDPFPEYGSGSTLRKMEYLDDLRCKFIIFSKKQKKNTVLENIKLNKPVN